MAIQSPLENLCVVLVSTRNPLNIGAAARAMSNFGARRLRVVNPYELAFREARSAVGASPILKNAEEYKSVADAVADCTLVVGTTAAQNRELQHPLYTLSTAAPKLRKQLATGRVAILFGSEKRGLSNHDFSHCHWLLHISTADQHLSMNLGQAVAVCLYELARESGRSTMNREPLAQAGELELVTTTLLESLQISGYVKPRAAAATEEKIRRLVRRLHLTSTDAETVTGMLRKVIWKMKNTGNDSND
ncbi:MAG: RNA methyltransferase [Terriglobales bacterium]